MNAWLALVREARASADAYMQQQATALADIDGPDASAEQSIFKSKDDAEQWRESAVAAWLSEDRLGPEDLVAVQLSGVQGFETVKVCIVTTCIVVECGMFALALANTVV